MSSVLSFRVLGPLEIRAGEERIQIRSSRQRIILALLLLRSDRAVPVERLVEAIWGEYAPPTARSQVVICISGLRRIFADAGDSTSLLRTSPPGYIFHAAPEQVDLLAAERLAGRARTAENQGDLVTAAKLLRMACGMWEGPVLEGIESSLLESEARRLEDKRLTWAEHSAQLELSLGRHREVIDDLAELVRAHPLREQLRAQLMLAQYRCGRRADALETYRTGRLQLIEVLGIEPSAELQSLHVTILNDDPGLDQFVITPQQGLTQETVVPRDSEPAQVYDDAPYQGIDEAAVPAQLPADVPYFVGRSDEFASLDALLEERQRQGLLTIALVTGIGGVGKSGFAVTWAHRIAARFPDGQLYVDLRGFDPDAKPLSSHTVMGRFLRALGLSGDRIPDDQDERASLLRTVLAKRRMLILLDNARTIDQVRPLLPGLGTSCVIVTGRDPLGELTALDGARVVHLEVLNPADSAELLQAVAATVQMSDALRLAALCDGLPLALRIVGARLNARTDWTPGKLALRLADERRRLDELSYGQLTVRATFALSYRDLGPEAAKLFRRLGLLEARDFASWTGAALLEVDELTADRLIDQLVDARLLEVASIDGLDQVRYRFHDLVRLYARERGYEEESHQDRTDALERALGCWLALAEEAHRRGYGGDFTHLHSSAPRWRALDMDRLLEKPLDWLEAERNALISAISQAAHTDMPDLCWDLAIAATTLFEARSYFDDWLATHETALAAARKGNDLRGEAAVLYSLGSLYVFQQVIPKAQELFDAALRLFQQLGDDYGRALVLRNASLLDRIAGRFEVALDNYRQAKEIFAAVGDRFAEGHVLGSIAQIELERGRVEPAEQLLTGALELFRDLGSERGQAQILNRLSETLRVQGRLEEAEAACLTALEFVRGQGDEVGQAYLLRALGEIQLDQDRREDAAANLQEALALAQRLNERFAEGRIQLALGRLRMRGQPDEAITHLLDACDIYSELDARLWEFRTLFLLGQAFMQSGDLESARDVWTRALTYSTDSESAEFEEVRNNLAALEPTRADD
ncbi:AfsR/SARP family transcriptional regulator [Nonomuraea recticatena]|uniref:BTAD domain-containing putative transcriptional regulator n=1 Tax=Nonomuraea recticatena TaxID=46178 RepID=A0ABN3TAF0_9ACTN